MVKDNLAMFKVYLNETKEIFKHDNFMQEFFHDDSENDLRKSLQKRIQVVISEWAYDWG